MSQYPNLHAFLNAHKSDGVTTHTSMNGGSYFIGEDDLNQFYDLYAKALRRRDKQFLTEVSTPVGPCRVDFDFIYEKDVKQHLHTRDQVKSFVKAYVSEIAKYVAIPNEVDIYIMEKEDPTYNKKKDKMKSGIHVLIPEIKTRKQVEQRVRRTLLNQMETFFPNLPLIDSWDKVYDEAVVNRSCPWTLYGSQKPENIDANAMPYKLTYILHWDNNEFTEIDGRHLPPDDSSALIRTLSIRRPESDETPLTEEGKQLYESVRASGQDAGRKTHRGRPAERVEHTSSRGSSPNGRILQPLDPEVRNYIRRHVMNLNTSRADDYSEWIKVGQCLHNIHPDLLDVFLDFSAQNTEKYNESDCVRTWNSLTYRIDGDRLSDQSLRYWSREDNAENYLAIEEENITSLMKAACSLTEYDMAALIYGKFRDNYKCSDYKFNIWYRWAGHIWKETDSGVDLLLRLSKEVARIFFKKAADILDEMSRTDLMECSMPIEKKDCGKCDYCLLNGEKEAYERVFKQLKKTSFKTNVMKECRELFFDEQFNKKLNANNELIAFNNGVMELDTMTFRPGRPEDYISYSTGIDYYVDRPYYEYPAWPHIEKFIHQVLPIQTVREYFIKHLATNLFGGNTAQKFHILTGSGSNGKSMIANLMAKVLGDYACTVPISLFTQKRASSSAAAPEVARLRGRRFVTMQEPDEAVAINSGLMKQMTSGEKMFARDLFKSGSEFEIISKFHLACNDKPKINTTDGGTWRRLVVINFISKFVAHPSAPNEFPLDESIQFAVNSTEWAVPFLSYLVHVLKTSQGIRKLEAPQEVLEYTREYQNENDAIAKFISETLVRIEGDAEIIPVDKKTLRQALKTWKDENDQKLISPAEVEKRIESQFGKYRTGGWTTFKLKN